MLLDVGQALVDLFVELLQVLHGNLGVGQPDTNLQIHLPPIGHTLPKRNAQYLALKKPLLPQSFPLPSHHKLPNQSPMITALLPPKLNKQRR